MNSKSRTPGRRNSKRTAIVTVATLAMAIATAYGTAVAKKSDSDKGGEELRHISRSVSTPGSREVELYRVPTGKQLIVKQACQENPAMYVSVGQRGDRISFSGHGCTHFDPGYIVAGGQSLYCVNKSGQSRNCVLMGMLKKSPDANTGARIIDVNEELSN
jgi:hypothetical protein